MSYAAILDTYIKKSGKTLDQISQECADMDISVHPTYISKLRLGKRPAPSEDITRALAKVTGGDPEKLIAEANLSSLSSGQIAAYERHVKRQLEIESVLDALSDGNQLFPFLENELRESYLFRALPQDYLPDNILDKEELTVYLTNLRLDEEDTKIILSYLKDLAESPAVLYAKLQNSQNASMNEIRKIENSLRDKGIKTSQEVLSTMPIYDQKEPSVEIEVLENLKGKVFVDPEVTLNRSGFALIVHDDNMSGDRIQKGDIIIVLKQDYAYPADIALLSIKQGFATLRRVKEVGDMYILMPSKVNIEPEIVSKDDVRIIGKVVEVRFFIKKKAEVKS
ncbi:LexA family protein [Gorillibacterium timonense]|uniref:LexA family protein n=1 Tax=Gorillibacterium timonense TaxID=1689269 RepID=UPI00071D014E|nr:S24 family peptidase [Gorillibacterium timonense]